MISYPINHISFDCPSPKPCNPEEYIEAMEPKISFDAKVKLVKA